MQCAIPLTNHNGTIQCVSIDLLTSTVTWYPSPFNKMTLTIFFFLLAALCNDSEDIIFNSEKLSSSVSPMMDSHNLPFKIKIRAVCDALHFGRNGTIRIIYFHFNKNYKSLN